MSLSALGAERETAGRSGEEAVGRGSPGGDRGTAREATASGAGVDRSTAGRSGEETASRRPDSGLGNAPQSRRENRDSLFSEVPTYSSQRS